MQQMSFGSHENYEKPVNADEASDEILRGFREFDIKVAIDIEVPRIIITGRYGQDWQGPYMKALCRGIGGDDVVGQYFWR